MVIKKEKCSSCKVDISNQKGIIRFNCPNCGKTEIIRCEHCRKISTKYICKECNFSGPN